MSSHFVVFFSSAFCIAAVFVNGALSCDPDAFAGRETGEKRYGRNGAFTPLHSTSQTAQECECGGRKRCVCSARGNERRKPEYVFFTCVVL